MKESRLRQMKLLKLSLTMKNHLHMRQLLKTKLVDMDLSVRALNCLKAAEVDTLGDLVSYQQKRLNEVP
jgi:DNA-directed RNA polymerase alpha subunit